jgi:hypothetical protein
MRSAERKDEVGVLSSKWTLYKGLFLVKEKEGQTVSREAHRAWNALASRNFGGLYSRHYNFC